MLGNEDHLILGVHVQNRVKKVPAMQELFTRYGCSIKTRLGLHHVADGVCSPNGLILLEMYGDQSEVNELIEKLQALDGIDVQKMVFTHEE